MNRILIPTDHSSIADNAIEYVLMFPDELVSEVCLFHAGTSIDDKFARLNKEVSLLSEKFKVNVFSSQKEFSVDLLNEIIKARMIDIVVMGTGGEDGSMAKKIFGSNTSSVIDDLVCPLISVPGSYKGRQITKIGYASDFIDLDDEAGEVISFARAFNAQLEILHVIPVYPDLYDTEKIDLKYSVAKIRDKYNYSNIQYAIEETENDNEVLKGIEQYARHYDPDLLVMFHENRSEIDKLITPSETAKMIAHLKKPLLVLPKYKV